MHSLRFYASYISVYTQLVIYSYDIFGFIIRNMPLGNWVFWVFFFFFFWGGVIKMGNYLNDKTQLSKHFTLRRVCHDCFVLKTYNVKACIIYLVQDSIIYIYTKGALPILELSYTFQVCRISVVLLCCFVYHSCSRVIIYFNDFLSLLKYK